MGKDLLEMAEWEVRAAQPNDGMLPEQVTEFRKLQQAILRDVDMVLKKPAEVFTGKRYFHHSERRAILETAIRATPSILRDARELDDSKLYNLMVLTECYHPGKGLNDVPARMLDKKYYDFFGLVAWICIGADPAEIRNQVSQSQRSSSGSGAVRSSVHRLI